MSTPRDKLAGCVLAGGQGQRLAGIDKGLAALGAHSLVELCLQRLRPQVSEILISANRNQARYRALNAIVFDDRREESAGPLAGFLRAMEHSSRPYVVTTACDSPFIPHDMVARLWQPIETDAADISVVSCGGYLQPVFALFPITLRDSLNDYLQTGERKITGWFQQHRLAQIEFADAGAFTNINTPADLEQARVRLHADVAGS